MEIKYLLSFLLGFFSCLFIFILFSSLEITGNSVKDIPEDRFSEEDIIILEDKVILKIENASLSEYESTGSMLPFFGTGANGLRIVPNSAEDINVGDIVSYRYYGNLIVHRVIEKGTDNEGIYFICQGDNSIISDQRVRFEDIEYVTVAIIY